MRKFAKISAVLAAMVLALAFAGCNSSSDDDDGSVKYAESYIEFTSDTTAKCYEYFDQEDVDDEAAPSVGYFLDTEVNFKTNGNTLTVTDGKFYYYEKGDWPYDKIEDIVDEGTDWSLTYTISGSELTEVFKCTKKGESGTDTTKYTKVTKKPTEPSRKYFQFRVLNFIVIIRLQVKYLELFFC